MKVQRWIIIRKAGNRIVATCGGTYEMMEKICDQLDRTHNSVFYFDDESEEDNYKPQIGPNISLKVRN